MPVTTASSPARAASPEGSAAKVPAVKLTAVHLVTLGCARNEVDSEELAGRLEDGGFRLVEDPSAADAVLVNTCGFIEAAKKDSVDTLLAAADLGEDGRSPAVVAVGCLAERYGAELAQSLPEADAVLGFDDYADVAGRLRHILAGGNPPDPRPPGPADLVARWPRRSAGRRHHGRRFPGSGWSRNRCPTALPRPADPGPSAADWDTGRPRRSRSPRAATAAAPSARSPPFAGPTCPRDVGGGGGRGALAGRTGRP